MNEFEKDVFAEKLASADLGYTRLQAQFVSDRLSLADADIKNAAIEWLEKGVQSDLTAEGWDVGRFKSEFGMNTIAALLTIDWLRKDPNVAMEAIRNGIK